MKIVTDTASLFSPQEGQKIGVTVVPACVIDGENVYQDYEVMRIPWHCLLEMDFLGDIRMQWVQKTVWM